MSSTPFQTQKKTKSAYEEYLKNALAKGDSFARSLEEFTHNGKPIGSSTLGIFKDAKKVKTGGTFIKTLTKPKQPRLAKKCLHCEQEFEWDHKHSKAQFEKTRFCNSMCKKLYFHPDGETTNNTAK